MHEQAGNVPGRCLEILVSPEQAPEADALGVGEGFLVLKLWEEEKLS